MTEITVTVCKVSDNDVMRFNVRDKVLDVSLTGETGNVDLKHVFEEVLTLLMEDDVHLAFLPTDGYGVKMYENVCREYIASIQKEIDSSRSYIISEGLTPTDV